MTIKSKTISEHRHCERCELELAPNLLRWYVDGRQEYVEPPRHACENCGDEDWVAIGPWKVIR